MVDSIVGKWIKIFYLIYTRLYKIHVYYFYGVNYNL